MCIPIFTAQFTGITLYYYIVLFSLSIIKSLFFCYRFNSIMLICKQFVHGMLQNNLKKTLISVVYWRLTIFHRYTCTNKNLIIVYARKTTCVKKYYWSFEVWGLNIFVFFLCFFCFCYVFIYIFFFGGGGVAKQIYRKFGKGNNKK